MRTVHLCSYFKGIGLLDGACGAEAHKVHIQLLQIKYEIHLDLANKTIAQHNFPDYWPPRMFILIVVYCSPRVSFHLENKLAYLTHPLIKCLVRRMLYYQFSATFGNKELCVGSVYFVVCFHWRKMTLT